MEAVVFCEGLQQLRAQPLVQQHNARATGHSVAQIQSARALARQPYEILQPLPLELAAGKQHLCAATPLEVVK